MATLQQSLDLQPAVSSVGNPSSGVDTSSAQGIQVAAGVADTFLQGRRKRRLEGAQEELEGGIRDLADEVFAANTGKELEGASSRFKRLAAAREQGALTDTMVQIEAEAVLKESIGKMPAFAPELRRFAADILGYDPTGSQVRALLDIPTNTRGQTTADKIQDEAEGIALHLGVDARPVARMIAKNMYLKQKTDLLASQGEFDNADRKQILGSVVSEGRGYQADFLLKITEQVQAGGVQNPQELGVLAQQAMLLHKQRLQDVYLSAGLFPDSQQMASDQALIEQEWEPILKMAQDGSLATIAAENAKTLTNLMTIEGFNAFGPMAAVNQVLGQEGVKHMFLLLEKWDKQGQSRLLQEINPALREVAQNMDNMSGAVADAYARVMGADATFSSGDVFGSNSGLSDEQKEAAKRAIEEAVAYDIAKNSTNPQERAKSLNYLRSTGQRFKALGAYFQQGARQRATQEEVRWVTQTFEQEYTPLVERVASELSAIKDRAEIKIEKDGQLRLVPKNIGNPADVLVSTSPAARSAAAVAGANTLNADLIRLNSFAKGAKNGWAEVLGIENPSAFTGETLQLIQDSLKKQEESEQDDETSEE